MTYEVFRQVISGAFAAHGKVAPTGGVLNAVWERVHELPDRFMLWVQAELCDLEKLPGNLGYHIAGVLWPLWRRSNQDLRACEERSCPECSGKHDVPGAGYYCFRRETDGWRTYLMPCRCSRLPKGCRLNPLSRAQALAAGYRLIPDTWEGGILDYERFLKFGETRAESRRTGQYGPAVAKAGKIDPFGRDERRFRHVPEEERV